MGRNWGNSSVDHPIDFSNPNVLKFFAGIEAKLAARNYSRPTSQELGASNGVQGVDLSSWCGESTWGCLKSKGYSFGIVREYEEICAVDPNGVHSVANAWAAGIAHVDIYLYPAIACGTSPETQVDQTIDSMGSIPFGMLWFDIESGGSQGPARDHSWLTAAAGHAVARLGKSRVGIYSSAYMWSVCMGSYSDFNWLPIWYGTCSAQQHACNAVNLRLSIHRRLVAKLVPVSSSVRPVCVTVILCLAFASSL